MKNRADIETRLLNELGTWFPRQCENVYEDFYLWYAPTTAERDGGILIAKERPTEGHCGKELAGRCLNIPELDRRQRYIVAVVTRIFDDSGPVMNKRQIVDEVDIIIHGLNLAFSLAEKVGICLELAKRFGV